MFAEAGAARGGGPIARKMKRNKRTHKREQVKRIRPNPQIIQISHGAKYEQPDREYIKNIYGILFGNLAIVRKGNPLRIFVLCFSFDILFGISSNV